MSLGTKSRLGFKIFAISAALFFVFGLIFAGQMFENVDANEIMVVQDPIDGELHFHVTAGIKSQMFGTVTTYEKRRHYEFSQSIRFNDAGKATLDGSVQWEMPLDVENLTLLHTKYGSPDAIEKQLVAKSVTKGVYMTGPLMSSRESYAEKRTDVLRFVQDQLENGVYVTEQRTVKTTDLITGQEKTITLATIVVGKDGAPQRQETSALTEFGISTFNFTIDRTVYEDRVQTQIAKQQELNMEVQTAIAASKKAEQERLTAEQQGRANVMTAKYEKEVEKERAIVTATQRLEVAKLDKLSAEQEKQRQILLGQGEATRKKLVMSADGALKQKLDTMLEINKFYAKAISEYKGAWVPSVVMGTNGKNSASHQGALDLVNLLTVKTAKDLALDTGLRNK